MHGNTNGATATAHQQHNGSGRLTSDALSSLDASRMNDAASPTDTLRAQVRRVMNDEGFTQKAVATKIGVSTAVLNQWLQGDGVYQGNERNVVEKVTAWLTAHGERVELQALLPSVPTFFSSATAEKVISGLRLAQSTGDMVTILGVPGVGKTESCKEYQRQSTNVWRLELASAITSAVPVLQEIAETLGVKGNGSRALMKAIMAKIAGTDGLIIIDEAHHMGVHALDAVRALHDKTGIGIAFVGGVELDSKVQQMPQFFSRLGFRLYVTQLQTRDVSTLIEAWGITDREQKKFLQKLGERRGALRSLTKTLKLATMLARNAGCAIGLEQLEVAAQMLASQTASED